MTKGKCINDMSAQELVDNDVPYLVNPDDLKALGIDPALYRMSWSGEGWAGAGWALDRKKDTALIERLRSMTEPHGTRQ
jgi:hypothetical protein